MILRMSLPGNALNIPNFSPLKVETLLPPTTFWTRAEVLRVMSVWRSD